MTSIGFRTPCGGARWSAVFTGKRALAPDQASKIAGWNCFERGRCRRRIELTPIMFDGVNRHVEDKQCPVQNQWVSVRRSPAEVAGDRCQSDQQISRFGYGVGYKREDNADVLGVRVTKATMTARRTIGKKVKQGRAWSDHHAGGFPILGAASRRIGDGKHPLRHYQAIAVIGAHP